MERKQRFQNCGYCADLKEDPLSVRTNLSVETPVPLDRDRQGPEVRDAGGDDRRICVCDQGPRLSLGGRHAPRSLWEQIQEGGRLPEQESKHAARFLRLPGRAVDTHADGSTLHRKHLRHRAPPHHPIEGLSVERNRAMVFKLVRGAHRKAGAVSRSSPSRPQPPDRPRRHQKMGDSVFVIISLEIKADAQEMRKCSWSQGASGQLWSDAPCGQGTANWVWTVRGRPASVRGKRRPETFAFLVLTFYCGRTRDGRFIVKHKTVGKRLTRKLTALRRDALAAHGARRWPPSTSGSPPFCAGTTTDTIGGRTIIQRLTCHRTFIQRRLDSRGFVRQVARVSDGRSAELVGVAQPVVHCGEVGGVGRRGEVFSDE